MDAAHLHLILNHFPVIGSAVSLLVFFAGIYFKSAAVKRTGFSLFILTGLLTVPTFLTGEPAEKIVEHLPGISEALIEEHEEFAELAVWSVYAAATVSLLGLYLSWKRAEEPKWLTALVCVLGVCSIGVMAWTGNLGGRIAHPELRGEPSAASKS